MPSAFQDQVFGQSAWGTHRRVVDNFEDLPDGSNTLGGAVTCYNMSTCESEDADYLGVVTPHHSVVWVAEPSTSTGWIRWAIPYGKRNMTGFDVLSFRAGLMENAPGASFKVILKNGSSYSPYFPLSNYDSLPVPKGVGEAGMNAHMRTFRIPLSHFGSHNDVRYVYFYFNYSASVGKQFMIDNLEFADAVFPIH